MVYMLTFTINIPQMLAYIPAPWILWVMGLSENGIPPERYGTKSHPQQQKNGCRIPRNPKQDISRYKAEILSCIL